MAMAILHAGTLATIASALTFCACMAAAVLVPAEPAAEVEARRRSWVRGSRRLDSRGLSDPGRTPLRAGSARRAGGEPSAALCVAAGR